MANQGAPVPRKLRAAPIVEALLEVQFSSPEPGDFLIGRLADDPRWRGFKKARLPMADFPAPLRTQDPNLRFQPTFEMTDDPRTRIVKVGPNVFSHHVVAPQYPGWPVFGPELRQSVQHLFDVIPNPTVSRLGFRYVNLFMPADHYVSSVNDLDLSGTAGGESLRPPMSICYRRTQGPHIAQVTIASPEFVQSPFQNFSALVDVDVSSVPTLPLPSVEAVWTWVEVAHDYLKVEFFRLLPASLLAKLAA